MEPPRRLPAAAAAPTVARVIEQGCLLGQVSFFRRLKVIGLFLVYMVPNDRVHRITDTRHQAKIVEHHCCQQFEVEKEDPTKTDRTGNDGGDQVVLHVVLKVAGKLKQVRKLIEAGIHQHNLGGIGGNGGSSAQRY